MKAKPVIFGFLKGAILGGGVGYGAHRLGMSGGWNYVVYGTVGLLVGLIAGKPFWKNILDKNDTVWTSVMQGIVGAGICIGMYALARHALGDPVLSVASIGPAPVTGIPYVFAPLIGVLWGMFVEIDDAMDSKPAVKKAKPAKK